MKGARQTGLSGSSQGIGRKSAIARFSVFEADLEARELRKQGRRLRLQDQPFALLATLLERAGEVVSRDELRQTLWPSDTFVDFDHSLNTAVNKIRESLGDSAASPRFVETVARRGYRFLGDVRWADEAPGPAPPPQVQPASRLPRELPAAHRGITRSLFALIQIMYLVFYAEALIHWQGLDRASWLEAAGSNLVLLAVLLTAGVGIPVRLYLISAVGFDHPLLGEKFRRIFIPVFLLDELWAAAPFLILDRIGFGAAFAAMAALLYTPFAERTLVRMAYEPGL